MALDTGFALHCVGVVSGAIVILRGRHPLLGWVIMAMSTASICIGLAYKVAAP